MSCEKKQSEGTLKSAATQIVVNTTAQAEGGIRYVSLLRNELKFSKTK